MPYARLGARTAAVLRQAWRRSVATATPIAGAGAGDTGGRTVANLSAFCH